MCRINSFDLSYFKMNCPAGHGAQTTLLTTLLDSWMQYWPQHANALNLLIIVTVLLINFIVNRITGASIDKGVGGK